MATGSQASRGRSCHERFRRRRRQSSEAGAGTESGAVGRAAVIADGFLEIVVVVCTIPVSAAVRGLEAEDLE